MSGWSRPSLGFSRGSQPRNWLPLFGPKSHVMFEARAPLSPLWLQIAAIALVAMLAGISVPTYVNILGESYTKLLAFPLLVVLAFVLVFSRVALLLLIVFFRGAADEVLNSSRTSFAGVNIGAGGLVNAFVILIAILVVVEKPGIFNKKLIVMWAAFFAAGLAGVMIAPSKADAVRLYLATVSNFAIFVSAFYFVRTRDDFKICVRLVVWSAMIPVLYGFFTFATGLGMTEGRVQSSFSHPNVYAFYLNLVIAILLYMLKSSSFTMTILSRTLWSGFMLVLLVQLLLTQTRSAWVACFVLFALYGFFFERRYLIYVTAFPLFALLTPTVQDRLLDLNSGNEVVQYAQLNSFAWRRYIWESALSWMDPMYYVAGYGLDSFKQYSNIFFPLAGNSSPGAHNTYVQVFFELGAIGLLAFLWLFWKLLWVLRPMIQIDKLVAVTLGTVVVEYLIVSGSDNMLYYLPFNWYFWFMLGGAYGVVTVVSRAQAKPIEKQRGFVPLKGKSHALVQRT